MGFVRRLDYTERRHGAMKMHELDKTGTIWLKGRVYGQFSGIHGRFIVPQIN
jgi:hypothetical protein